MEDRLETILLERLADAQKYIQYLEDKIAFLQGRPSITVCIDNRDLQDYAHCPYFTDSCRETPCPDCNLIGASRV